MTPTAPEERIAAALSRLRQGPIRHSHPQPDEHSDQPRHTHRAHGGHAMRRVLLRLAESSEPLSVSDIAVEIGVDQPRASRLVAQGVDRRMLRREADPDDARRTRIALTAEGRAAAERIRQAHAARVADALAGFEPGEQEQLADLLARLADAWASQPKG